MSLKLYYAPGACSFVPHALLEMAGATFEPVLVKLHRGEQNEAAFRAVMKAWFTHSPLYEIFQALSTQDCTVVVTTDHGSVLGKRAALVYGNRDTSTNLRYKYGINLNTDPKQAIIVRKPMEYLLPDDGVNKNYVLAREDYYFVYPTKFHEYERQYRGSFQHGGVSVEEMILPLMTLRPRSPRTGS